MQHAIINAMKCMRTIKDRIARLVYQLANQSVEPLYHAQCINRGNHRSVIFRARQLITARWYSDTTSQSVTTPMIVLDFSGTTTQSASHNVALNQVINQSVNRLKMYAFDWAVKMRIRPPELETSICDVKYHVSLCCTRALITRDYNSLSTLASITIGRPSLSHTPPIGRRLAPPFAAIYVIGLVSIIATRSFHPCQNTSDLLVQIDGGILIPVVDLIDDLPPPTV
ncbi:hypothetical protein F511_17802 [Dorcoceras hygrometricum]|uniref:Uncharacterized protein n=1 Tax=Dorcoceras hygrometricum TaxID=472368 RepID=A0A2Z7B1V5_9LAMI|nr:hypothetical protein F511_17802 [Dorcoceras hygrometricum]